MSMLNDDTWVLLQKQALRWSNRGGGLKIGFVLRIWVLGIVGVEIALSLRSAQ
jgi:hypothetical protein